MPNRKRATDLVASIEAELTEDYRKLATDVLDSLVNATPVNKDLTVPTRGRLKANWNVSKARRDTHYDEQLHDISGGVPKADGRAITETVELGDTVYYTNATPYGNYVNAGTHKQRPQRFVERGLANVGIRFNPLSDS